MLCVPGVATPTEAFAALAAGADGLKMFPAEALPPAALRAWRAVLPQDTLVFAVGGMKPDNLEPYWAAGASGFGTGSNLYKPGARQASCAKWRPPTRPQCVRCRGASNTKRLSGDGAMRFIRAGLLAFAGLVASAAG